MDIYFAFSKYDLLITVTKKIYLSFKPTYLYIKTHNKTGLKYFGKTTSKTPHKYKRSGSYWNNHLSKHGNDISTEIIGFYKTYDECLNAAITYSRINDIIKSENYANLKDETLNGGWEHVNERIDEEAKMWRRKGRITHSDAIWKSHVENNICTANNEWQSEMGARGGNKCKEQKLGWFSDIAKEKCKIAVKSLECSLKHSKTAKERGSYVGYKNSQFGSKWIHSKKYEVSYRISANEVENYLSLGWELGSFSKQYCTNGKLDKSHKLLIQHI